ncbi:MAG TPA: DUF2029 domain-containing protein [Deltaproteobacteria bacterium]|nr:DUF2029 domain-containing protein [Deltaproteobacteria bacterium]
MKRGRSSLGEPAVLLLSLVAFCSILSTAQSLRSVPAIDFYQFWVVGREVAAGSPGNIYSDSERRRIGREALRQAREAGDASRIRTGRHRVVLETFSTPFLYSVFGALSSGNHDRDLLVFRVLGIVLLGVSVAGLCAFLGHGPVAMIAAVLVFVSWFAPTRSDLLVGNVNILQLAWLVLFLWVSRRFPRRAGHFAGGLVLGSGAMFKPNTALVIGLLAVAWLVRRRHEKLLFESIGIGVAVLVAFAWSSAVFGGFGIWWDWWQALSSLPDRIITVALGNYAPARLVEDWLGVDPAVAFGVLTSVLALVAIGQGLRSAGAPIGSPADRPDVEDLHVAALAGVMMLLSSPLAWLHYYVATIPLLLIALVPLPDGGIPARPHPARALVLGPMRPWLAMAALIAISMEPLELLGIGDGRERAIGLCLGTGLLFGIGLARLTGLQALSGSEPASAAEKASDARAAGEGR